jgi:hypothetical protein
MTHKLEDMKYLSGGEVPAKRRFTRQKITSISCADASLKVIEKN